MARLDVSGGDRDARRPLIVARTDQRDSPLPEKRRRDTRAPGLRLKLALIVGSPHVESLYYVRRSEIRRPVEPGRCRGSVTGV